jgi:hypothetical protein
MAEFTEQPGGRIKRAKGRHGGEYPGDNDDRKIRKSVAGSREGKRTKQRLRDGLSAFILAQRGCSQSDPGESEADDAIYDLVHGESRSRQHAANRRT